MSGIVAAIRKLFDEKRNRYIALIVFEASVVTTALGFFSYSYYQYTVSKKLYNQAENRYVTEIQSGRTPDLVEEISGQEELGYVASSVEWWNCIDVNLVDLEKKYPDVIGWIYFENEEISYPILYSGDNDKYLYTAYNGKSSSGGSIFLDGESTPDFSDSHSLMYGHNMRDGSMFGKLRSYISIPEYYETHQYFQIFCGDMIFRYQVFAYGDIPVTHEVYEVYGLKSTGLNDLIKEFSSLEYCDENLLPEETDKLVTLSTCNGDVESRMIVCAVRVDSHRKL